MTKDATTTPNPEANTWFKGIYEERSLIANTLIGELAVALANHREQAAKADYRQDTTGEVYRAITSMFDALAAITHESRDEIIFRITNR